MKDASFSQQCHPEETVTAPVSSALSATPSLHTVLGKPPWLRGVLFWSYGVLLCVAAWYMYQWMPIVGLVAIGLSPLAALLCFFRGYWQCARSIPYYATWRRSQRGGLSPTWSTHGAGFFIVDANQGLWVANGIAGTFASITALHYRLSEQAFILELHTEDAAHPVVAIGMESALRLHTVAERLRQDIVALCTREVSIIKSTDEVSS